MEWLKKVLFARFVPHRTLIGLGLFVLDGILGVVGADQVCNAAPAVCEFVHQARQILTPWLVIAGIRDRK